MHDVRHLRDPRTPDLREPHQKKRVGTSAVGARRHLNGSLIGVMVGSRRLPCTVVSCRRLPCRRILCQHRCHGPTLFLRRRHHHLHLSVTWRPARCSTLHRGHLLDLHRHLGTSSLFEQRQQHLRDLHRHLGDLRSYYSVWWRLKRSSTNSWTRLISSLQYCKVGSSTGRRHRLQHHLMCHGRSFFAVSCSLEHVAFWKCVPSLAHACTDQLALQRATCKYIYIDIYIGVWANLHGPAGSSKSILHVYIYI